MGQFPYPDEPTWWTQFNDEMLAIYKKHNAPFNMDGFKWGYRTAYDCGDMDKDLAKAKHFAELEQALHPVDPAPIPPVGNSGIVGQLKVDGLTFKDDRGLVLPLLCHFGEAFSAYVRRPDEVRAELDRIKAAGYDGIRFWDVLGYYAPTWKGKEVTPIGFTNRLGEHVPATPDYYGKLKSFLRDIQSRGMVVQHSRGDLNAIGWNDILNHCELVGAYQREVGSTVVALNEACNESWQNGVPEIAKLREMGDIMGGHALRGTSAPDDGYGGELPDSLNQFKRDVAIIHGYRGGASRNRIGHIHAVGYDTLYHARVPAWQGEPAGPGSGVSVGQENNVEALCLMAAMSLMTRQAWVYMSGHGVFWDGSIALMPGFHEVPQIRKFIPRDIMAYDKVIHGGSTWQGSRVFVANADGTLRCDHTLKNNGDFMAIIYGDPGGWQVPVERNFDGVIITPTTGEVHDFNGRAGEIKNIDFERGRIVIGKII